MSWFSDHAVLFALLCAGAAVVFIISGVLSQLNIKRQIHLHLDRR